MNFISQFSSILFGLLLIITPSQLAKALSLDTITPIKTSIKLSANPTSESTSLFKEGHNSYKQGNLKAALLAFDEAIRLNPKFIRAYIFRGIIHTQIQEYESAIKDYTQAITLDPKEAFAYGGRGIAWNGLKDYKNAIADFTQAIKINPQVAQFYKYRGTAHTKLQDYHRAVNDFTQAINIKPRYTEAYLERGNIYYKLNNQKKAIADYTQVIKLDPKYPKAYANRSVSYVKLKEYQNAVTDCNQALNIDSKIVECHYNKGLAYLNLGKYQQAVQEYNQALKFNPKSTIAYQNRGVARTMLTDIKGGIKDLQTAADFLKEQGKTEKYQKILQVIATIKQEHQNRFTSSSVSKAYNLYSEAKSKYQKGDVKAALAKLDEAIRLNPKFASAYRNRGIIRALSGNKQAGIDDLQKAAQIYKQQGKTDEYSEVLEAIRRFQQQVKPVLS
ncbi:MAG: tetratricopeptide repeat protein [Cyanobacteria bacterium P01_A01_bin.45]|mgnify:CR=1 FL=1